MKCLPAPERTVRVRITAAIISRTKLRALDRVAGDLGSGGRECGCLVFGGIGVAFGGGELGELPDADSCGEVVCVVVGGADVLRVREIELGWVRIANSRSYSVNRRRPPGVL